MDLNTFQSFDPLDKDNLKSNAEVELKAARNSIKDILTSYVGWYDPFAETIQNAMDAVEKRLSNGELFYKPKIWIIVPIMELRTKCIVFQHPVMKYILLYCLN